MLNQQLNLFDGMDKRLTLADSMALTNKAIATHGEGKHWVFAFSGGKDSTTTLTYLASLVIEGKANPKRVTVLYADTRLELPPLHSSALSILERCRELGWYTEICQALPDKRLMVNILGRGVIPPNNATARWCTGQIKLTPMREAMQGLKHQFPGDELLNITGVRLGESAARDAVLGRSCTKTGSECGQGWFYQDLSDELAEKLAPLLHWRVCHIWEWLMFMAPSYGFDTTLLAEVYGGDEAVEANARTGCIGCPLVKEDTALINLIKRDPEKWGYLEPLNQVRDVWQWVRLFKNRHQKNGERNQGGELSSNPMRKGCLTLAARSEALEWVLSIQSQINAVATEKGYPLVDILNDEEIETIRRMIRDKVYPQKWDGTEPRGDVMLPQVYRDGSVQLLLPIKF